jgi:hypothetical protein
MADISSLMLSDGYGLNKERRLRDLNTDPDGLAPLQPVFPYEVVGFDDLFFFAEPSDAPPPPRG